MAKATVIVTVDNRVKKGLDPAKKSMLDFQTVVDGIQKKISKAFSIATIATVAVKSIKEVTQAAIECVNAYGEAEKVMRRLEAVWTNVGSATGKSYAQIMQYADAVEKQTYFTSEAVEEASLLLAATESLTEEGFQRALDASVDLASALGEDVTSAAQTLAKAIQEPESALSRLKTIGVSFTDEEKEQIKTLTDANKLYEAQSIILDKVEQKYKGVAKAVADTPIGTLDAIKDTWGDIKEDLGEGIVGALAPAFEYILGMLKKIHEWARDHLDKAKFWEEVETANPHTLYSNYTEEFLKERQRDASNDVAAQLELIRQSPWGEWIESAIETPLEDLLWMENSTLESVLKTYLPEDFEYTLEGFFKDLKEPYDRMVKISENIDGALSEYVDNYTLETPVTETATAVGEEVTNALDEFLKNFGDSSEVLHVSDYNTIIENAKQLINGLVDWQDEEEKGFISLLSSVEQYGLDSKEEVNNAFVALNKIIDNAETKINEIKASIGSSATLSMTLGSGMDKYSTSPFSIPKTSGFTFTGENIINNGGSIIEGILDRYGKESRKWQLEQLEKQYTEIENAYVAATDSEKAILDEILDSTLDQIMALKGIDKNTKETADNISKNFLQRATDWIAKGIGPQFSNGTAHWQIGNVGFDVDSEQASSAASSVMGSLIDNLGEAGDLISKLATNMASMGPILGAIVTAFEYVMEGFGEVFGDVMNEFVEYGLEPLREFGRMIGEVLLPIMDAIMPSVESTAEFLIGIFDTIGSVLEPIVHTIAMSIAPVLKVIGGILQFILPFIQAIGNALIAIVSTVEWFMEWFEFLMGSLGNWMASIHVGGWYPFRGLGGNNVSKPTDLGTYIKNNMIDTTGASDSVSTDTAISSASYRGATSVTINIYQMSPVVGENGMRQFAQMIREEFDALDYYGVSA